jgi:hypothetical protein
MVIKSGCLAITTHHRLSCSPKVMLGLVRRKAYRFRRLPTSVPIPISGGMNLELDDEQTAALINELSDITENSRYPFSRRVRVLREILTKLRPEPLREPLPPPKHYAPPRAAQARRRRGYVKSEPGSPVTPPLSNLTATS